MKLYLLAAEDCAGSGVGAQIGIGVIVICVVWIFFPFAMLSKANKIIRLLREISE